MSNRFPADDEHLHPYPGNLKHHKVDKKEQRKLLYEMMKDDAKSGMYDAAKRKPLLRHQDGYTCSSFFGKECDCDVSICEAACAKDAELIQRLVDALKGLVFLEFCNEEGLSSGAPTSKDWKRAFDKAQEQIDAAAEAGFKPTEP